MKNRLKSVNLSFIFALAILLFIPVSASAATVSLNNFDLVDSGKHLDFGGTTKYLSYVRTGANTWNAYKGGVVREDTVATIEDVTISDYYEITTTAGETANNGTIRFNTYQLDGSAASYNQRLNVATHELGHALGLGHNTSADIMYKYVTSIINLTANDKESYNTASILY